MPATLVLFVDGLPFDQLEKMTFASTLQAKARLIPVLGYSVNCQTQLFTGKSPDELGFWCEWSFDPKGSPYAPISPLLKLAAPLERSYLLKRVIHRVMDRIWPRGHSKNIPLAYLPLFRESGHTVFSEEFDQDSLLEHPDVTCFLYRDYAGTPNVDAAIHEAALKHLKTGARGSVLCSFIQLDHVSHWQGVDSEEYDAMLAENDRAFHELTEAFLENEPDGTVLIVSDHGMSNIHTEVKIDLEGQFGRPSAESYAYFTDGTILRAWVPDASLLEPMRNYLDGIEGLDAITDEDRRRDGISRPEFGDLIYHTPEGLQIVPSFWGPKPSAGMHGHHPRFPGQHGICLSNREVFTKDRMSAVDFYSVLSQSLEG